MKKLFSAALCLLATGLLCPSFGATQLAIFNGFANRTTQGDYTLDLNGNSTNENGSVTIASTPIKLTYAGDAWSGGSGGAGISILLKYSNLYAATNSNAALMSTSSGTTQSYIGCYATTSGTIGGISANNTWGSAGTTVAPSSGYLAMVYVYGSGTKVYSYTNNAETATSLYSASGLQSTAAQVGKTLSFGGATDTALVATNLTIEGVVVYQGALSSASDVVSAITDYESYVSNDVAVVVGSTTTVSSINSEFATLAQQEGFAESPTNRAVIASGDLTVTVDADLAYDPVYFETTGDLHLVAEDSVAEGTVISTNITGFGFASVSGNVYYDYTPSVLRSASCNPHYTAGAGSSSSTATISLVGGSMELAGGEFYYPNAPASATSTTNTTVLVSGTSQILPINSGAAGRFNVGEATYILTNSASIVANRFSLSTGGSANRTSVFTLCDAASVTVSGQGETYGYQDSTDADIMFGHWNGQTTYTQSDNATFTAESSEILVGRSHNNHTININGGTMSVLGIKTSENADGTNAINLGGGTLNLGTSGIDSYTNTVTIPVTVSASSTIGGTTTTEIPITQTVTVNEGATLTFSNALANAGSENLVTINVTNTLTSAGSIEVLEYVNLNLGDATVDGDVTGSGTITVSGTASLLTLSETSPAVTLADTGSVEVTLAASGKITASAETQSITVVLTDEERLSDQTFTASTATVKFVDEEGNTLVSSTDGTTATYSVADNYKAITITADGASVNWSDDSSWTKGGAETTAPTATEPALIIVNSDITGTVVASSGCVASNLTVKGGGTVTITSAENLSIPTTESITIDTGTTLAYNVSASTTNNLPMLTGGGTFVKQGAGAVFRYTPSGSRTVAESVTIQLEEGAFRVGMNDSWAGQNPIMDNVTFKIMSSDAVFSSFGWLEVIGTLNVQLASGVTNSLTHVDVSTIQPVISYNSDDADATMTVTNLGSEPVLFGAPVNLPTEVESGATLSHIPASNLTTVSAAISGDGAVLVPSATTNTISGASTYTGGTTIEGCTTVGSTSAFGTGTMSGSGQVIITSADYIATGSTESISNPLGVTFADADLWTGTVTLRNFTKDNQNFSVFANENSTLEFDGVKGYFPNSFTMTAKEFKISSTTASPSGYYGFHVYNGNSSQYSRLIGKFTGDGPIRFYKLGSGQDTNVPTLALYLVGDFSEWKGDVATGGRLRLLFSEDSTETTTVDSSNGHITVSTELNVATWTGTTVNSQPVIVDVNTNGVLNVTSDSSITPSGGMTFAEGAKIVASDTTEESPATFTAALTFNGATTLSGGHVLATSATGSGTLTLADTDSELILTSTTTTPTVASGLDGYAVDTKTVTVNSTSCTAYYLKKNVGIRVRIY